MRTHLVLRAVSTEDSTNTIVSINVGANAFNREFLPSHDAYINATFVIAIDQHDVLVHIVEHLLVESDQRRAVFRFNDTDNVGVDVIESPGP